MIRCRLSVIWIPPGFWIGRKDAQEAQKSDALTCDRLMMNGGGLMAEDGGRTTGGAYGPSQTHGLESPCHVAWAFQPMSG